MLVKSGLILFFIFFTMTEIIKSDENLSDFSSFAALRPKRDAHFNYEIKGNFIDPDQENTFNIHVYIRPSSHGNHLIFFKSVENDPQIPPDDQNSLTLPFIAVVRKGFLRSMYAWPNETRKSLLIKGELAQIVARDFSADIAKYVEEQKIDEHQLPDSFTLKTTIEDTPVGRGCYNAILTVEKSQEDVRFREVRGTVERGQCEEVFSFSSYYQATSTSNYNFVYKYDADSNQFRGAFTKLELNIVDTDKKITLTNKLEFVEYVDETEVIDDTKLRVSADICYR